MLDKIIDNNRFLPTDRLRAALGCLKQSRDYASNLEIDLWEFAVEIMLLRDEGLVENDFRWLVCKGYVEHAADVTAIGEDVRTFRKTGRLRFCRKTCFVLTEAGAKFLDLAGAEDVAKPSILLAPIPGRPRWDADRQELRFGEALVKQFNSTVTDSTIT
jgi:hypothetical protein